MICNVADLIAADLSPYFFFVFWTAEYAKKRQGAAALFAPKEKESLLSSPLLHSASPLLSCPSCCRTKVYANRQRRSRMMGTKRMAHFTTRCQERGYRFTWDASQITAAHAMQRRGGRVPVGDEQDTGRRRNAGLGILRYSLHFALTYAHNSSCFLRSPSFAFWCINMHPTLCREDKTIKT